MKFEHLVEFKRSALAGITIICATVALCFKAIDVTTWTGIVGGAYALYTGVRTKEEHARIKNGYGGGYINENTAKAKEALEKLKKVAGEDK